MLLTYPAACTHASEGFTMGLLWAVLLPRVMPEFRNTIPVDVYARLEKAFPGKLHPKQAIEAFILGLVKKGYVQGYAHQFDDDDHFYVSRYYADDLHAGVEPQSAGEKCRLIKFR